jgi:hypothetical protein
MASPLRFMVTARPGACSRELVRGHLYLTVAQEREGSLVELSDEETAGVGREQLIPLAMSMLRQSTARADVRPVNALPGLHLLVAPDGHAASRMVLLPELLSGEASGGVIVAVPASDKLLIVPVQDTGAIESLEYLASALSRAVETAARPLSDQLFWFDGKRWVPITVKYDESQITVLPPPAFVDEIRRLAAMELVREAAEA